MKNKEKKELESVEKFFRMKKLEEGAML